MDWIIRNILTPSGYFVAAAVATLALLAMLGGAWLGEGKGPARGLIWPLLLVAVAAWAGLTARLEWGVGEPWAVGVGLLVGLGGTAGLWWAVGSEEQPAKLSRSEAEALIGREARVYRTIPRAGEGEGRIELAGAGRRRIVPATSDGPAIPAFTQVVIAKVDQDQMLIVRPRGGQ